MISLKLNNLDVQVKRHKFSDGAIGIKLEGVLPRRVEVAQIYAPLRYTDPQSLLFEVASLVDIVREINSKATVLLFLPYLPYARQDRRMVSNDALTLKVFTTFLNSLNLDAVLVFDCHSDVGVFGLNNVHHVTQDKVVSVNPLLFDINGNDSPVIVAPDAGALKKIDKVAGIFRNSGVVVMGKRRDVETGNIVGHRILESTTHIADKRCVIFDDICDGGATFISAAAALREAGAARVELFVTHGIFSRGVPNLLENGIDKVYTTDSVDFGDREQFVSDGTLKIYPCFEIARNLNLRGIVE